MRKDNSKAWEFYEIWSFKLTGFENSINCHKAACYDKTRKKKYSHV